MGIRLKVAESAKELDDVFWLRHEVYANEEGYFDSTEGANTYLVDRFDTHPKCANLIAYDGTEPIGTIRLNLDAESGLPPEDLYDFSAYRARLDSAWNVDQNGPLRIGSAGMLAIRKGWRKRRDVIRSLFKLAAGVGQNWKATHILVSGNHLNALMYKRVGFQPLDDRIWIKEIGEYIVPMAATYQDFRNKTIGKALDSLQLLKSFESQFQRAVFRAGDCIFRQAEKADECYIVDVGSVKITVENPKDHRELTFSVLGKGEIFGELALIDAKTRSANAVAATDTEVIVLRRDDFLKELNQNPKRLELMLNFISDRLRRTDQLAMLLAYGTPRQRLEFALGGFLQSAKVTLKADGTCILRAGPADLAAAAGTQPAEATGFLEELATQGYCEFSEKQIHFLAPDSEYHPKTAIPASGVK